MKRSVVIVLIVLSFIAGIVVARVDEYQASGKRRVELLKEKKLILEQYETLNEELDMIKNEIQKRETKDSITN